MNIYVGNLDFKIEEKDLEDLFSEHGTVNSVSIITDKYSGRSRGFGFVTMDDQDEARTAIDKLNGNSFEDREMVVTEARPKKNNY